MRKIVLIALFAISAFQGFASSGPLTKDIPSATIKDVMIPLIGTQQTISLEDYLALTPTKYLELTGKKLNLRQRIDLSVSKHIARKMVRKDGTVDMERMKRTGLFGRWQWHWGGFALGFFLSILGPIVALFFNDEYKWDRFWTALHTSLALIAIVSIIVAAAAGGGY